MSAYRGAKRWDLYWADLDPSVGHEQGGPHRPVLIISNDGFNRAFDLVTVVPLTKLEAKRRRVYTFEVIVPAGSAGNPQESILMPQQIRTISTMRLKGKIGTLYDPDLKAEIEDRLLEHLDLQFEAEF